MDDDDEARYAATTTATPPAATGLLRAIAALGPRLHDRATAGDPARLYTLVCDALRECGLFASIGELREADGPLRVVATSLSGEMTMALEYLLGAPILGYALPVVHPYDAALGGQAPVVVDDITQLLAPFLPHLDEQQ